MAGIQTTNLPLARRMFLPSPRGKMPVQLGWTALARAMSPHCVLPLTLDNNLKSSERTSKCYRELVNSNSDVIFK